MMETAQMINFVGFSFLSLAVAGFTVIRAICVNANHKKRKWNISSLQFGTFGIFLAIFLFFIPVCYAWDGWLDGYLYVRPVFLTLLNTVRVFLLEIDFDFVENALPAEPQWLKALLSLYGMILYVVAPFLTFSNLLAIFKNLSGELWVRICQRQEIYVLSELNPQSVALAKSIAAQDHGKKRARRPLIVFCDVFTQNEEGNYELLLQARELSAICLKKDVSHIALSQKGKPVEIFLIGENETENNTQIIRLNNALKETERQISVYIFSSDPATEYILDSLHLGTNLLSKEFRAWLETGASEILRKGNWEKAPETTFGRFSIHHIDPLQSLVKDVLTIHDYEDYRAIQQAADQNKTISVTVLGMGNQGTQFLKTAIWFYQRYGIRVEFNVFDLGIENGDPKQRFGQACPELKDHPNPNKDGEANYDIKFFTGIDCFSAVFDDTVLREHAERFKKTNLVFVALGDDDRNIRAARMMERLFAINEIRLNTPAPFIYAVVYDDEKAANLNLHKEIDPKKKNTGAKKKSIVYVGARLNQYAYETIQKSKNRERAALVNHLDWLSKECQLRDAYESIMNTDPENLSEQQLKLKAIFTEKQSENGEIQWADGSFYESRNEKPVFDGPVKIDSVIKEIEKYMRESYFRRSSVSKAFHREALQQIKKESEECTTAAGQLCLCDNCQKKRITEHMRWNAYMRSMGYRKFGDSKDGTAGFHKNLVSWYDLTWQDQFKD